MADLIREFSLLIAGAYAFLEKIQLLRGNGAA